MKIAFYAPMKPPTSPVPSGDREMARNLIRALETDHTVTVATDFVGRDGAGDPEVQARLAARGAQLAEELVRNWRDGPADAVPDAWFTYHVYHKAPDWLGPAVCDALNIPYFIAEASHAPKQAGGPWDTGYRAAEAAIRRADGIIGLSSLDAACVTAILPDPGTYHRILPFTDTASLAEAAGRRARHRADIARQFDIDPEAPILLAVGMMRDGDKLASYRVLAEALQRLADRPWTLVIVGDGPARADVEAAFAGLPASRVIYAGAVTPEELPNYYAAADLMVWPAVNEAYGMAMLEAQAAGLPVVAGRTGGVPDVVRDGVTGRLCPVGNSAVFAETVAEMLGNPRGLASMRKQALALTAAENSLSAAAAKLNSILRDGRKACAA